MAMDPVERAWNIANEFRACIVDAGTQTYNAMQERIAEVIREAVAEERNACLHFAEQEGIAWADQGPVTNFVKAACKHIADKIRCRGKS